MNEEYAVKCTSNCSNSLLNFNSNYIMAVQPRRRFPLVGQKFSIINEDDAYSSRAALIEAWLLE
jgi:hypothetical protein